MRSELKRKLDYSDYVDTPDDGMRYEILDGDLSVTPSPSPIHQRTSRRFQRVLEDYFHGRNLGEVFNAPIDVILAFRDIVQPDLVVVADPKQISGRGIEGAPLAVVEILSPSSRSTDTGVKARRYGLLGVPHYWLLDPEAKSIICYRLDGDTYKSVLEGRDKTKLTHPDWEGLVIDLEALWS